LFIGRSSLFDAGQQSRGGGDAAFAVVLHLGNRSVEKVLELLCFPHCSVGKALHRVAVVLHEAVRAQPAVVINTEVAELKVMVGTKVGLRR